MSSTNYEDAVACVREQASRELVTLVGVPGIAKSRLARPGLRAALAGSLGMCEMARFLVPIRGNGYRSACSSEERFGLAHIARSPDGAEEPQGGL